MSEKVKVVRYENNPFFSSDMGISVPVRGKQVKLSRIGRDENILINQTTGEVGGTHLTTVKVVDSAQFVKLFTANIALTFDLKAAGIKAFNVLIWIMQHKGIERDLVPLDKVSLDAFLSAHDHRIPPIAFSQPTFWRGLAELEKAQIVAKHVRQGWYFINPNFVFNGDRIAFTTVIQREDDKKTKEEQLSFGEL